MNKVILMGRLVKDTVARYTERGSSQERTCVARYTLAVNRRTGKDGQQSADFINCVAFGKSGEFADQYLKKGMKVLVTGRIQTGSYNNKEGNRVYTTDVVVEEQEFAESKNATAGVKQEPPAGPKDEGGFMDIPDGIDEELPFN